MGNRECISQGADDEYPNFDAKTEADARAKMLVYILENKLIRTAQAHDAAARRGCLLLEPQEAVTNDA